MSFQTTYNWSSGNLSLLENYRLVRITGAGAGSATLTLPQVTAANSFIDFGYSIVIVDTGGFVSGVTIQPNGSDGGYLINGDSQFIFTTTNGGITITYDGDGRWVAGQGLNGATGPSGTSGTS